jgi:hypothetical protein
VLGVARRSGVLMIRGKDCVRVIRVVHGTALGAFVVVEFADRHQRILFFRAIRELLLHPDAVVSHGLDSSLDVDVGVENGTGPVRRGWVCFHVGMTVGQESDNALVVETRWRNRLHEPAASAFGRRPPRRAGVAVVRAADGVVEPRLDIYDRLEDHRIGFVELGRVLQNLAIVGVRVDARLLDYEARA